MLFTVLADSITVDGINMLNDLKAREPKYVRHPGVLQYTMRSYAEVPEFYKRGILLFLRNTTTPSKQMYEDALPGFVAVSIYLEEAPSSCAGLYYASMISMQIGNWSLNLSENLLRKKVQRLNL